MLAFYQKPSAASYFLIVLSILIFFLKIHLQIMDSILLVWLLIINFILLLTIFFYKVISGEHIAPIWC